MVHINQVEFENFKSFGGNVKIPLEEGFTVVTGPNGSGKSNILDGILFCLGLANSRGMRAERLPDLIITPKLKRVSHQKHLYQSNLIFKIGLQERTFRLWN